MLSGVLLGGAVATLLAAALVAHLTERKRIDPERRLYSRLREDGMIVEPDWPLSLYVKGVRGRTLHHPVLKWRNEHGDVTRVMAAREGELRVAGDGRELQVLLRNGSTTGSDGGRGSFAERAVTVALPAASSPR
jgi:hypothetical protein